MFKPMPNFKTTTPFIVNLQVYVHSAKLLECIHVIQCMIEHYFTYNWIIYKYMCSMCSLAVSTQDSPAVEPRSNPSSSKILMSENLRLYTTSPVVMC